MTKHIYHFFVLVFFLGSSFHLLKGANEDSLKTIWNNKELDDSLRFDAAFDLVWGQMYTATDSAVKYSKQYLSRATAKGNQRHMVNAGNALGVAFWVNEEYDSAVFYLNECIEISRKIKFDGGIASAQLNLGMVYDVQGNYKEAIRLYEEALKTYQIMNDRAGLSSCYNNIAMVFKTQGLYEKAIDYLLKGLEIDEETGNEKAQSITYNNLGLLYNDMEDNESALTYFNKCLNINIKLGDSVAQAYVMNNLGLIYFDAKKFNEAIETYLKAIEINRGKSQEILSKLFFNIGTSYLELKEYNIAKTYLNKSLIIRKNVNDFEGEMNTYLSLAKLYFEQNYLDSAQITLGKVNRRYNEIESVSLKRDLNFHFYLLDNELGRYQSGLQHLEQYMVLKDSILKESNLKNLVKQNFKYEYEKQKAIDDKENEKRVAVEKEKQQQQFIIIVAALFGVVLVVIFLLIIYRRLQITRKQKVIIEEQKEEVVTQRDQIEHQKDLIEEKHLEIQDSILYAKRIQEAILPSLKVFNQHLQNSFVLYCPKDVVAGDFYWLEEYNDKIYVAAADCTGHGVPGAMVSVVCSNALTKSLLEEGITETSKILDRTRELVVQRLAKSGENVMDGMDISLACFDFLKMELQWSGANNPVYIVTECNSELLDQIEDQKTNSPIHSETNILLTVKGDKQPIGYVQDPMPFTSHKIKLHQDDKIYLFTDGYADQFGGERGKKMGYKKFREKLLEICDHDHDMDEQKALLEFYFREWKGPEEQVDDICVIGVRV